MRYIFITILVLYATTVLAFLRANTPTVALCLEHKIAYTILDSQQEHIALQTLKTTLAEGLTGYGLECIRVIGTPGYKSADFILDAYYTITAHPAGRNYGVQYFVYVEARLIHTGSKHIVATVVLSRMYEHGPQVESGFLVNSVKQFSQKLSDQLGEQYRKNIDLVDAFAVTLQVEPEFIGKQFLTYKVEKSGYIPSMDRCVLQFASSGEAGYLPSLVCITQIDTVYDVSYHLYKARLDQFSQEYVDEMQALRTKLSHAINKYMRLRVVERTRLHNVQVEEKRSEAHLVDNRVATEALRGALAADYVLVGDTQSGMRLLQRSNGRVVAVSLPKRVTSVARSGSFLPRGQSSYSIAQSAKQLAKGLKRSAKAAGVKIAISFSPQNFEYNSKRTVISTTLGMLLYERLRLFGPKDFWRQPRYAGHIQTGEVDMINNWPLAVLWDSQHRTVNDTYEDALFYVALTNYVTREIIWSQCGQVVEDNRTFEVEQESNRIVSKFVDNSVENAVFTKPIAQYIVTGYADFTHSVSPGKYEYVVYVRVCDTSGLVISTEQFIYHYPDFKRLCKDVARYVCDLLTKEGVL